MTRFRIVGVSLTATAVLTLAATLPSVLAQAQAPDPPATAVIARQIVDAVTGMPVSGAGLTLRTTPGTGKPRTTVTDAEGRYEFSELPPATYTIDVRAAEYLPGTYGALRPGDWVGNRLELRAGERAPAAPIRLWPPGRISGRVTDDRGEPAVGLLVRLLRQGHFAGQFLWRRTAQAHTDDRGQFAASGLRPGHYLVAVPSEPVRIGGASATHEVVLYAAARSASDASVIALGPGDSRAGVDMMVTWAARSDRLSVSGRVIFEAPRRPGMLRLVPRDVAPSLEAVEGFTAYPDADGHFSLTQVPPGDYRLRGSHFPPVPRGGAATLYGEVIQVGKPFLAPPDLPTLVADMPLSLTRSVDDLVVTLQPGAHIVGRVLIDGLSALPRPHPLAGTGLPIFQAHADEGDINIRIPTAGVDAEGRFQTVGLPAGRYVLDPYVSTDGRRYVLTSVRVSGREVLAEGIDVGAVDLTDVVLTFTDRHWTVSGTVRDDRGRVAAGARVIIFPRDRERWRVIGFDSAKQRSVVPVDLSGRFQSSGWIAGDYFVAAVANPPEFWRAPEYLETLVPVATPVRLELGAQQAIELRLR